MLTDRLAHSQIVFIENNLQKVTGGYNSGRMVIVTTEDKNSKSRLTGVDHTSRTEHYQTMFPENQFLLCKFYT